MRILASPLGSRGHALKRRGSLQTSAVAIPPQAGRKEETMNIRPKMATVGTLCLIILALAAPGIAATAGDYDGDGKADIVVFRPLSGTWFIIPSSNPSSPIVRQWGTAGDIPVPGDYDGDGKTDIAVWRPSTGTWYIIPSSNPSSPIVQQWGAAGDIPVPGDYDGDGKTDIAVWRPSTGTWFIIPSSTPTSFRVQQWGTSGDIPVPGDYDGDRKTDVAVWRPSTGTWYIIPSSNPSSPIVKQWGTSGDLPVPGDYDGDGKTDMSVWRPSSGTWFVIPSSSPTNFVVTQWGISTDIPGNLSTTITTSPAVVGTSVPFPIFAGDPATPIAITVTNDVAGDGLTASLTVDSNTGLACTPATCGSLGSVTGTSGSGSYSVLYTPPAAAGFTVQTAPTIVVSSSLPGSFTDTDFIEVDPAGVPLVNLSCVSGCGYIQTGSAVRTLTATVYNDTTLTGVTFTPLTASGYACDSTNGRIGTNSCGTLGTPSAPVVSGTTTTTTVTYTPPAVGASPSAPYDGPRIQATSKANNTQLASGAFLLSSNPPPVNTGLKIPLGNKFNSALASPTAAPITVNANIGNDTGNSRTVNWTLTAGGVNCSPTCGTLGTPTPTGNGTFVSSAINYTPPSSLPTVAADLTPTITATSVDNSAATDNFTFTIADGTCGTGHESVLNGQYAFLVRGGGANAGYTALIGSFSANGAGGIATGGSLDSNGGFGPALGLTITSAGSSYTVGADNRVCLTLADTVGDVLTFRAGVGTLVNGVATEGRIIRFDDNNGRRVRQSGVLMKQTPPFATSQINGTYALGLVGVDSSGGRFAGAGVITANGAGALSNFTADFDDAGAVSGNLTGGTGTYIIAANGRGTSTTSLGTTTTHDVLYVVSPSEILLMSTDSLLAGASITSGELKKQTGPFLTTTFDNNDYVIHGDGLGTNNGNDTTLAQATFTTNGNATLTLDENNNGTLAAEQVQAITLTIAPNGRTTITASGGGHSPILYLIDSSSAFLVGTDPSGTFGFIEQQTGGPFSDASLSGQYFFGGDAPTTGSNDVSGTVTADGAGNATGNSDSSGPNGLKKDVISGSNGAYSFSTSSVPQGRGTVGPNSIAYVISGSKLIFLQTSSNPEITIVQK